MSFIKGAAEVITGYGSQIKAADDFNDKVGGKDSLVGRGIASFAQGLVYVPLTQKAYELTTEKMAAAKSAFAAGNSWEAGGNAFTSAVGGIATLHMASRVAATVLTLLPNVRESLEKNGTI
jgi:hypothetical protein